MHILTLTNFYPPCDIGGYEQLCDDVMQMLRARGHRIAILTSKHGAERAPLAAGAEGRAGDVMRTLYSQSNLAYYRSADFWLRRGAQERENQRQLEAAIGRFKPDVLFVWGMWNLDRGLPAAVERQGRLPVAYYIADLWPIEPDVHAVYWSRPPRRRWLRPAFQVSSTLARLMLRAEGKRNLPRFEHVACVSAFIQHRLQDANPSFKSARVIRNGIDPDAWPPRAFQSGRSPGMIRLVYVGGLAAHKGVHTLVEALAHLKKSSPETCATTMIVGGGHEGYLRYLRQSIAELGLTEEVHLVGRVARECVSDYLQRADAFVFPSEWEEPLARAPMEAMASGLPVIGSLTGGTGELLIHMQNGLTFEAGNWRELAEAILQLAWDPSLAQALADAGRRSVLAHFVLARMADDVETFLYESAGREGAQDHA